MAMRPLIFTLPIALALASCAASELPLPPGAYGQGRVDPADVERVLIQDSRERFGSRMVDEALRQRDHIVAWRGNGGIPVAPPPGEPWPEPPPPRMALLMKRDGYWLFADSGIWRQARPEQVAEIERLAQTAAFRSDPVHVPPCPDYPGGRLLLRMDGGEKIAREHMCPNTTDSVVSAALSA